jgi:hypothetical protein
MTVVPATFEGRKQLETEAWRLVRKIFERHGWKIAPLGLNRTLILPEAEPLVVSAPFPPTVVMLVCVPDAIAFHEPTQKSWLVELKSTNRDTFSLRCRDFAALLMWQALLVVVHLPSGRVHACLIDNLPAPQRVDAGGLAVLQHQFPEVAVLTGVTVAAGSKAPFAVWELERLPSLEGFLVD